MEMDLVIFIYILVLPISLVTAITTIIKYYSTEKELRENNDVNTNILLIIGIISLIIVAVSLVFLMLNHIAYTEVVYCL